MKSNNLLPISEISTLESINTYKQALMQDINLSIRLCYNHQTYNTRLVEWSGEMVIFEAPMHGTNDIILPINSTLNIILVSSISLFGTTFLIQKKYRHDNTLYYVAQITSPLVKRQQRQSFRLNVILDVKYHPISSNSNLSSISFKNKATCVNISLGGMCLVAEHQFHSKEQLLLSFSLLNTSFIFKGEIVHLGELNENGTYTHGVRFFDLDNGDTNKLNRLIFEKQRLQLKHS